MPENRGCGCGFGFGDDCCTWIILLKQAEKFSSACFVLCDLSFMPITGSSRLEVPSLLEHMLFRNNPT